MAVRNIVKIDEQKCDGCGQCIVGCAEGALAIVDGKASVVKESYCDGLGACLGVCPQDAITLEQREADAFDEEAVEQHLATTSRPVSSLADVPASEPKLSSSALNPSDSRKSCDRLGQAKQPPMTLPLVASGCPGAAAKTQKVTGGSCNAAMSSESASQLGHWPVQLTLVPPGAPFLRGADLLLVADCVPFAMADFHERFLQGRAVVVGCPKLDDAESYVTKLSSIVEQADLHSLTIVRMEVPCCSGLCRIASRAWEANDRKIPVRDITVNTRGQVIEDKAW